MQNSAVFYTKAAVLLVVNKRFFISQNVINLWLLMDII